MVTKKEWIGGVRADAYKTVIDWDAVGGAILVGVFVLIFIGWLMS